MNAAFLLVTAAWLTGADPAPKPAPPPPPPAASACGPTCGDACNACNDCCKPSLCDRLKARFHRNRCGCDTCCAAPVTCCPAPKPVCAPAPTCCDDGCGRPSLFDRIRACCQKKKSCCDTCAPACAPAPVCKPAPVCCKPAPVCAPASCGACCEDSCRGPGLLDRLRACFHKKNCCDTCDTCAGGACGAAGAPYGGGMKAPEPIPAPKAPPKKMPNEIPVNPASAIEAPLPQATISTEETKNPFELSRRYESRVNNAPDYSSLTGQLFYVHADGGLWVLRYAPVWKEDPNGGSIVLARDLRMDSYREGDLVTVHGEILSKHSSVFLGGPLYRASAIQLVDREAK